MSGDPLERHAREIETQGYTVIENVLTLDEIEPARAALCRIFEEERDVGRQRGWHNDRWTVAHMLPQKDEVFRRLPLNARVLSVVSRVLGPRCLLSSLNGLTMSPRGRSQDLHLDQPEHVPGLVLNVNALLTLDDFERANGCTRVVPFSQRRAPGTPIDPVKDEHAAVHLETPAGSLIAYDGGLVHAGSANTGTAWRRCLHVFYTRVWAKPQWDFPRSLSPDVIATLSDEQKRLFGFGASPRRYDAATHQHLSL